MTDDTIAEGNAIPLDHDEADPPIDYADQPIETESVQTDQAETDADRDRHEIESLAHRRGMLGGGAAGALATYFFTRQFGLDIEPAVFGAIAIVAVAVGTYPRVEPYIDYALVLALGGDSK